MVQRCLLGRKQSNFSLVSSYSTGKFVPEKNYGWLFFPPLDSRKNRLGIFRAIVLLSQIYSESPHKSRAIHGQRGCNGICLVFVQFIGCGIFIQGKRPDSPICFTFDPPSPVRCHFENGYFFYSQAALVDKNLELC